MVELDTVAGMMRGPSGGNPLLPSTQPGFLVGPVETPAPSAPAEPPAAAVEPAAEPAVAPPQAYPYPPQPFDAAQLGQGIVNGLTAAAAQSEARRADEDRWKRAFEAVQRRPEVPEAALDDLAVLRETLARNQEWTAQLVQVAVADAMARMPQHVEHALSQRVAPLYDVVGVLAAQERGRAFAEARKEFDRLGEFEPGEFDRFVPVVEGFYQSQPNGAQVLTSPQFLVQAVGLAARTQGGRLRRAAPPTAASTGVTHGAAPQISAKPRDRLTPAQAAEITAFEREHGLRFDDEAVLRYLNLGGGGQ